MFKVLLVYFYFNNILYSQNYDNMSVISPTTFGLITMELYVLVIKPFSINYGGHHGCDINLVTLEQQLCDLAVYSRQCVLNKSYEKIYAAHQYNGWPTFTMNPRKKHGFYKKEVKGIICGEVQYFAFATNHNEIVARFETEYLVNTYTSAYSTILVYTIMVVEVDPYIPHITPHNIDFVCILDTMTFGFKTKIHNTYAKNWTTYLKPYNTVMFEKHLLMTKCGPNFYGVTCWFHCIDNERLKCNCLPNLQSSNIPCKPICKPGWITVYIIYIIRKIKEVVNVCNIKDTCYKNKQCIYECFPINNSSFECEIVLSVIKTNLYSENLTSDIFLWNELITISLYYDIIKNKNIFKNIDIMYNGKDYIFKNKIIEFSFSGPDYKMFRVIGNIKIDILFYFHFKIYLPIWDRYFIKKKPFRIFLRPRIIDIYQFNSEELIGSYLYAGQKLFCNSSARPVYRTIYTWSSLIFKPSIQVTEIIKIKDDSPDKMRNIIIKAILIIKGRPNEEFVRTFNTFIKHFVYLKWNLDKNIMEKTDILECQFKAFIKVSIMIYQLKGPTDIDTFNRLIPLENIESGSYELLCSLHIGLGISYSRSIDFQIRGPPTKICLYIHTNTIGSIVQCGHNGEMKDEYKIIVNLKIFNSFWQEKVEGIGYIRIPYYMQFLRYMITCDITWESNKTSVINYKKIDKLFEDIEGRYNLVKGYQECPDFGNYVEKPEIYKYSNNEVIIKHLIFYFTESDFNSLSQCILFAMVIFILNSLILIFLVLFNHVGNDEKAYKRRIMLQTKVMRRGYLIKKLIIEAKKVAEVRVDQYNVYSTFMSYV